MGVYIKDMRMPTNCLRCPLWMECKFIDLVKRPDDCPLVEVEVPHGRLIDEGQIKTVYGEAMTTRYQGYISRTEKITHTDAPTVIERED